MKYQFNASKFSSKNNNNIEPKNSFDYSNVLSKNFNNLDSSIINSEISCGIIKKNQSYQFNSGIKKLREMKMKYNDLYHRSIDEFHRNVLLDKLSNTKMRLIKEKSKMNQSSSTYQTCYNSTENNQNIINNNANYHNIINKTDYSQLSPKGSNKILIPSIITRNLSNKYLNSNSNIYNEDDEYNMEDSKENKSKLRLSTDSRFISNNLYNYNEFNEEDIFAYTQKHLTKFPSSILSYLSPHISSLKFKFRPDLLVSRFESLSSFVGKIKGLSHEKFRNFVAKDLLSREKNLLDANFRLTEMKVESIKYNFNMLGKFRQAQRANVVFFEKYLSKLIAENSVLKERKAKLYNEIQQIKLRMNKLMGKIKENYYIKYFLYCIKNKSVRLEDFEKEDVEDLKEDNQKLNVEYYTKKFENIFMKMDNKILAEEGNKTNINKSLKRMTTMQKCTFKNNLILRTNTMNKTPKKDDTNKLYSSSKKKLTKKMTSLEKQKLAKSRHPNFSIDVKRHRKIFKSVDDFNMNLGIIQSNLKDTLNKSKEIENELIDLREDLENTTKQSGVMQRLNREMTLDIQKHSFDLMMLQLKNKQLKSNLSELKNSESIKARYAFRVFERVEEVVSNFASNPFFISRMRECLEKLEYMKNGGDSGVKSKVDIILLLKLLEKMVFLVLSENKKSKKNKLLYKSIKKIYEKEKISKNFNELKKKKEIEEKLKIKHIIEKHNKIIYKPGKPVDFSKYMSKHNKVKSNEEVDEMQDLNRFIQYLKEE